MKIGRLCLGTVQQLKQSLSGVMRQSCISGNRGERRLLDRAAGRRERIHGDSRVRQTMAWGKQGVAVSQMRESYPQHFLHSVKFDG